MVGRFRASGSRRLGGRRVTSPGARTCGDGNEQGNEKGRVPYTAACRLVGHGQGEAIGQQPLSPPLLALNRAATPPTRGDSDRLSHLRVEFS